MAEGADGSSQGWNILSWECYFILSKLFPLWTSYTGKLNKQVKLRYRDIVFFQILVYDTNIEENFVAVGTSENLL